MASNSSTYTYTAGEDDTGADSILHVPIEVTLMVAAGVFLCGAALLSMVLCAFGGRMNKATFYRIIRWIPVAVCYAVAMGYLLLSQAGLFGERVDGYESDGTPEITYIMLPLFCITAMLRVVVVFIGCLTANNHLYHTVAMTVGAAIVSFFVVCSTMVSTDARYAVYALSACLLVVAPVGWVWFHNRAWGGDKARVVTLWSVSISVPSLVVCVYTTLTLLIWCTTVGLELAGHAFAHGFSPSDEVAAFLVVHLANVLLLIFASVVVFAPPARTRNLPNAEEALRSD